MDRKPSHDLMAAHLEQVLRSRPFASSPKLREFLRFVGQQVIDGEGHTIKEFVVATEVYGRDVNYDPQVNSTVRVEASRLRGKLREYYRREGAFSEMEIVLPKGSYAPVFRYRLEPDSSSLSRHGQYAFTTAAQAM